MANYGLRCHNMSISPEMEKQFGLPCEEIRHIQAMLYKRLAERSLTVDLLEKHKHLLDKDIKFVVCNDIGCNDCNDIGFETACYTTEADGVDGSDDADNAEAQMESKRRRILQLNSHVECIRQGVQCGCIYGTGLSGKRLIGKRLIHLAASDTTLLPVVMYLHGNRCDMNPLTFDAECWSPIYFAVCNNQPEVVKYLVQKGVNVDSKTAESPLACAIKKDFGDIVKILLTVKDIDIDGCCLYRQPVLLHCVPHPKFCEMLLEAGADPNVPGVRGNTALIHAVNSSNVDLVNLLIRYGADVNKPNTRNQVALLFLVYRGDTNMTRILLEAGANPNYDIEDDRNSMIIVATCSGDVELLNILIKYGGDMSRTNSHGYTALHIAAWYGNVDCVKSLLESGASHYTRTGDQNTPLSLAAHGGHSDIVEILLPLGCNVNNADKDMDTPLHYSAYNGMAKAVQSLICHGADPNCCNRVKTTPLWNAVYMKHKDVVKVLLLANVKLEVRSVGIDQHSQTDDVVLIYGTPKSPLQVAVDRECAEIALLLVNAGYDIYKETWLMDTDGYEQQDDPLIGLLSKYFHTPPRLISICRNSFRSFFGLDLKTAVQNLDIPGSLKNYLTLEDLKNTTS